MRIEDFSHDELIAEVSRRLGRGEFGFAGLMSPHQQDYAGAWSALMDAIRDERDMPCAPSVVWRLEARAREIIDARPPAPVVYAVTTAYHGKDTAFQNHQRFGEAA